MSLSESVQLEQSLGAVAGIEQAYKDACDEYAEAKHAFKMKEAKEFLLAEGTVEARKAQALVACEVEHERYTKAQNIKTFMYQKLKDAQGAQSARQTMLSASAKGDFNYATNPRNT